VNIVDVPTPPFEDLSTDHMPFWRVRHDKFGAPVVVCLRCKQETNVPMTSTLENMTRVAVRHQQEAHAAVVRPVDSKYEQATAGPHYLVRVVVAPGEDLPVWVAHRLTFDCVSQGDTIEQALEAINEAMQMVIEDDTAAGLDPRERSAPSEYWQFAREVAAASEITEGAAAGWPRTEEGAAVLVMDYTFPANGSPPTFRRWARARTLPE
jgi:predicted RNase H-like HicB family nuclease